MRTFDSREFNPPLMNGATVMSGNSAFKMDIKTLADKAASARQRMGQVTTTQERQHFEGMARYWEELLDEASAAADAGSADVPRRLAG
jgi:hypothetical protein